MKERLDILLVKRNLAPSREKAKAVIMSGIVYVDGQKEDKAGSAKRYNARWHERTGLPIAWINEAGHNSNTDQPDEINHLIEEFVMNL